MKILVNATTCVVGGGVQVATTFINQAIRSPTENDFRFAVSRQVRQNLNKLAQQDKRIDEITPSPARLLSGKSSRQKLHSLESEFCPDIVFTVFGPAYIRFSAHHICGFADAWVTHRSAIASSALPPRQRMRMFAVCLYKRFNLYRQDHYWVEAEVARRGLLRILGISQDRIRVIPNTHADVFVPRPDGLVSDRIVRVFSLAAPYPHKNLSIIPEAASLLRNNDSNKQYKFVVTLPERGHEVQKFWAKAEKFNVVEMIENLGPLKLSECPQWYTTSQIVFLPTLLETFSATYPEAMVMGKPIVTTDLDFAHDICGEAAAYYAPLCANSAANTIQRVANDLKLQEALIKNGYKRLAHFPSPETKYRLMMQWISEVYHSRKYKHLD